ncbi:MAG: hypothetical protein ABR961_14885 [Thermoanaerobaculaceae bacterium]|jgi:hypothetical protein
MNMPLQSAYEQVLIDLRQELELAKQDLARASQRAQSLQAAVREAEERLQSIAKAGPALGGAPYAGLPVKQAAERFLAMLGHFAGSAAIADALEAGGYQSKSPSFKKNVHALLYRDMESNPKTPFVRNKKKEWGLKAWGRSE